MATRAVCSSSSTDDHIDHLSLDAAPASMVHLSFGRSSRRALEKRPCCRRCCVCCAVCCTIVSCVVVGLAIAIAEHMSSSDDDSPPPHIPWHDFSLAMTDATARAAVMRAADYLWLADNIAAGGPVPEATADSEGLATARALRDGGFVANLPPYVMTYKVDRAAGGAELAEDAAAWRDEGESQADAGSEPAGSACTGSPPHCCAAVGVLTTNLFGQSPTDGEAATLARAVVEAMAPYGGGLLFVCEQEGHEGLLASERSLGARVADASERVSVVAGTWASAPARTKPTVDPVTTRVEAVAVQTAAGAASPWEVSEGRVATTDLEGGFTVFDFGRKSIVHAGVTLRRRAPPSASSSAAAASSSSTTSSSTTTTTTA